MSDLKTIFGSGPVSVEQLGGGLDKLNFAVHSPEGFFIWQLSAKQIDRSRFDRLEKLAEYLDGRGIVTRRLVAGSLVPLPQSSFRWSAVYRGVPGRSQMWSAYSPTQIKNAVKYLELIHLAGRDFPERAELCRADQLWRSLNLETLGVERSGYRVNTEKLRRIIERLNTGSEKNEFETVLHGDYGRANIIFSDQRIAGVVDFDRAVVGHPVVDLGRFTSYLLLDTAIARATILTAVRQNYAACPIAPADLEAALQLAWFLDWLAWRDTPSEMTRKLINQLISEQLILKI